MERFWNVVASRSRMLNLHQIEVRNRPCRNKYGNFFWDSDVRNKPGPQLTERTNENFSSLRFTFSYLLFWIGHAQDFLWMPPRLAALACGGNKSFKRVARNRENVDQLIVINCKIINSRHKMSSTVLYDFLIIKKSLVCFYKHNMKTATFLIYVVCFLFITYASNIDKKIWYWKLLTKNN